MNLLYIGNRNYSSWSLRAWLVLRWSRVDFAERLIDLDQPGYGEGQIADIIALCPSGKVPFLQLADQTVWDTIGIAQWSVDEGGEPLLPRNAHLRHLMWSAIGEMHAGFAALRSEFPMNLHRRCVASGYSDEAARDIQRIDALWQHMRAQAQQHGVVGDYLLGERSLADAFFLPVATRLHSYSLPTSPVAQRLVAHLLSDADFLHWKAQARLEPKQHFSRGGIDGRFLGTDL